MNSTTLEVLKTVARFTEDRKQWELFSRSHNDYIRGMAVRNIFNSEMDYVKFIQDPHYEVRASVALCTKSEDLLLKLASDDHHVVRSTAIANPYGSKEVLKIGVKDTAAKIRENAEYAMQNRKSADKYDLNKEFREVDLDSRLFKGVLSPKIRFMVKNAFDSAFLDNLPNKLNVDNQISIALNVNSTNQILRNLKSKEAISARDYNPNWKSN